MFEYTAATTNATNKVTATPEDPSAELTVELNGEEIENGSSASWEEGENEIKVTVHGHPDSVYTVVVTMGS